MADLILEHYAKRPVTSLVREVPPQTNNSKPKGLWLSVRGEDDWPSWCQSEDFNLHALAVRHVITLAPDANILRLTNPVSLDLFTRQYASVDTRFGWIAWPEVARDYQGIIIAPYQWKRRLEGAASRWYYGWDCASGCIWDAAVVASIQVVEQHEMAGAR